MIRKPQPAARAIATQLVLALAYFLTAKLGLELATLNRSASPVWPASGLAVAALLIFGYRSSPAILIGAFATNAIHSGAPLTSLLIAAGNVGEAALGAALIQYFLRRERVASYFQEATSFLSAGLLGPVVSASVGCLALRAGGALPAEQLNSVWITWWIGDALGILALTPLLWFSVHAYRAGRRPTPGDAAVWLLNLALAAAAFRAPPGSPLVFLAFFPLLAGTAREGQCRIFFLALTSMAVALGATLNGHGPFVVGTTNENLVVMQLFLSSVGISALLLNALTRIGTFRIGRLILGGTWVLAALMHASLTSGHRDKDIATLDTMIGERSSAIRARLDTYEESLRSGAALFAASLDVDHQEWRNFVRELNVTQRLPGILGLGVVWRMPSREMQTQLNRYLGASGGGARPYPVPGFAIDPQAREHFVIRQLEPAAVNQAAIGLLIDSEPKRREAAELARRTGRSAVTSHISLVQDNQKRAGMMVFYPIYRNGAPTATEAERQSALLGWICAPMTWQGLLEDVLGQHHAEIDFELVEALPNQPPTRLFDTNERFDLRDTRHEKVTKLAFAQRTFQLVWNRGAKFPAADQTIVAWLSLIATMLGLLLASIVTILQSVQQRAQSIADQAVADLRTSEEKFGAIVQSVKDYAITMLDEHGRVLSWNDGARLITGYEAGEIIGQNFSVFFPPAVRGSGLPEAGLSQAAQTGRFDGQGLRIRKDGTEFWSEVVVTPIHDPKGGLAGFSEIVRDLTAQKRAEEERDRLIEILDASPDFIGIAHLDGGLLYSNRAAREVMDITSEADLHSRNVKNIYPKWAAQKVFHEGMPAVFRDGLWRGDSAFLRHDGHAIPVSQVLMLHTDAQGEPRHFSTIMRDMTEDRRREEREGLAQRIDQFLVGATSEADTIAFVTEAIAKHLNWRTGLFWKTNPETSRLEYCFGFSASHAPAQTFIDESRGFGFSFGDGLPGTVWQTRDIYWLVDARHEGRFRRAALAQRTGMRSGFGLPLHAGEEFLGCFEFFTDQLVEKDDELVTIFLALQKRVAQRIHYIRSKVAADQNHQLLQSIIDGYPGLVQVKSLDGKFKIVNQNLADTFGVAKESLIGNTLRGLVSENEIVAGETEDREIAQLGTSRILEKTVTIHGARRSFYTHKFPLVDLDGQIRSVGAVTSEVTQQVALKDELQRSTEWRRGILDGANVTIISTDRNGIIQSFNRKAEILLGYRAEDLVGRETPMRFHDPVEIQARGRRYFDESGVHLDDGFEVLVAASRNGQADENEWTYYRKDGSSFPVLLSVTTLLNEKQEITGYLGVGTDITEKREAQARLQQSERRLKFALEGSSDGMWDWDLQKREIYVSEKMAALFGGPQTVPLRDERDFTAVVHPDDQARTQQSLERHLSGQTDAHEVESRIRTATGDYRWMLTRGKVSERDELGRPIRMTGVHIDIEKLKRSEEELRQAEMRAKEAVRAKDLFLTSISHEIRTPLNGVIGMTDLLLETSLSDEQAEYAKIAQQSGASLLSIINDILDFSKIEAGKMELEKTQFSVAQLVEAQAEILLAKARQKKLSLSTFVSPKLPSHLVGDPGRLGQIILNLIGNAMKFTAQGGVALRAAELPIPPMAGGPVGAVWVRFEVEDTGIGLSASAQSRLFQPFSQADESISRKYGGTGLGLSICKRLVESMEGRIGITSAEGQGSTFWFELPLRTADTTDAYCLYGEPSAFIGRRVMILDEDRIVRENVHRYIHAWSMRNGSVGTSAEAFELLQRALDASDPYRIVIIGAGSDLQRALETGTKLRARFGAMTPTLLLAAEFGQRVDPEALRRHGFASFVSKPLKQSQLFDALANAIGPTPQPGPAPMPGVSPAAAALAPVESRRILVADDVSANQLLARRIIESLGHSVTIAANGLEVLELLEKISFDLIFMDCQMPELDGFDATRRIRAHSDAAIRSLPIIALTANAMSGDDKACRAAGMNDYLAKPVKKDQIRLMLERWLPAPTGKRVA